MSIITSASFGLERIARETLILLIDSVNSNIVSIQTEWDSLDSELATKRSVAHTPVTIEPIELENFHLGHKPSLIEAPVDKYPNIAVFADRAKTHLDQPDQLHIYLDNMYIELMCRATEDEQTEELEAEELLNRRVLRTVDAVNNTILSDRTLNGLVQEIPNPPDASISDVFLRSERVGTGKMWFWQGARIEYQVTKPSTFV